MRALIERKTAMAERYNRQGANLLLLTLVVPASLSELEPVDLSLSVYSTFLMAAAGANFVPDVSKAHPNIDAGASFGDKLAWMGECCLVGAWPHWSACINQTVLLRINRSSPDRASGAAGWVKVTQNTCSL